jgi:hypothetical protein
MSITGIKSYGIGLDYVKKSTLYNLEHKPIEEKQANYIKNRKQI